MVKDPLTTDDIPQQFRAAVKAAIDEARSEGNTIAIATALDAMVVDNGDGSFTIL